MISYPLLHAILFTPINDKGRWGLPVLFWGEPGAGKTDVIESIGEVWGLPTETLSPGERGEGAFGVTPVPSATMEYMTYPPPEWKAKFDQAKRGIVFLDEISCSPPSIQAPILGLVQARRIGGAYLGNGVRILGAANPPDVAAGGWDLAPPVANRFAHFQWDSPTVEEWTSWLFGNAAMPSAGNAAAEEERVMMSWTKPWAKARGEVSGFLRRRPEFMHKRPPLGDPNASKAWPSPRSWAMATRAIAAADVHGLSAVDSEEYVRACIGPGAANEFVAWKFAADLPDPLDVLDEKIAFVHDSARLDRTMAILSSCAALVTDERIPRRNERAAVLWRILGMVAKDAEDIAVGATKQLVNAKLDQVKESQMVLSKLYRVIKSSTAAA